MSFVEIFGGCVILVCYSMWFGSLVAFFRIRSGCCLASSLWVKSPERTAMVLVPAAFPAFMSLMESPTMMQSCVWMCRAFVHFVRASGEGFGLCVSRAVTTCVKYFAMPKCCSSFVMVFFGTLRMVIRASLAFLERVCRVVEMLGMGVVFCFDMA